MISDVDQDEEQVILFSQEYLNSDDVKKLSIVTENLKSNSQPIRMFCAKKLTELGNILGCNRIEEELIPYITDLILNYEDNEEVLTEFANQLLKLLMILQKSNIFSVIGIRSLEILSGNDDEIVRKTAIDNLSELIKDLNEELISNEIFPLMRRLIENDSKTKMSCCYLFPVVYPKLQNQDIKNELIQVYCEICHDESPSVRRAAADNIKYFCKVNDPNVIDVLIKLYPDFVKDPIDIVKIYAIESTKDLLRGLKKEEKEKVIMDLVASILNEKSWRVKYSFAENISDICKEFDPTFIDNKFSSILMMFLKDREPEVKCSVLANFDKYLEYITIDKFKENFLSIFQELSNDTNLHVRSVYATSILKCIKFFKVDNKLIVDSIMPLLTKLVKDEVYEVQYAAVANMDELILLANNDNELLTKCILPIIKDGMNNTKWRFRLFIAENLLNVVSQIPKEKLYEYYYQTITQLFTDHASEIRETSWKIIKEIIEKIDNNFLKEKLWNLQKEKMGSKNYILRIASFNSINFLKEYYEKDFMKNTVIKEIMNIGKKDSVPNVKFSSFQVLKDIAIYLNDKNIIKEVIEYIKGFENEKDADVSFFSKKSIEELEKK